MALALTTCSPKNGNVQFSKLGTTDDRVRKCDVVFNVQIIADPKAKDPQHASSPAGFPGANNFISCSEGSPLADLGNPGIGIGTGNPHTGNNTRRALWDFTLVHEFGPSSAPSMTQIFGDGTGTYCALRGHYERGVDSGPT